MVALGKNSSGVEAVPPLYNCYLKKRKFKVLTCFRFRTSYEFSERDFEISHSQEHTLFFVIGMALVKELLFDFTPSEG